jgi:hypothetical protein
MYHIKVEEHLNKVFYQKVGNLLHLKMGIYRTILDQEDQVIKEVLIKLIKKVTLNHHIDNKNIVFQSLLL